uniref:FYVE-type domain-containing protein n=1 Tax=Globisporangium ultimum (strain ATCC 200006 / CBS 805.95 / DAOM BR144) TaxID=431595 RepID=K3WWM2_GLOUD
MDRRRGLSAYYANEEERIQEILNDKSVLQVQLLSKENWIKNDQRPHCYYCQRKFRPFLRKHHCRSCGEVVCRNCNRHRKVHVGPTEHHTITVRLCFDCIDKALISAGKAENPRQTENATPDISARASSRTRCSAKTTSTVASSSISGSVTGLEFSMSESSVSGFQFSDESSSSTSNDEDQWRTSSHKQISRTYSNCIKFLPEKEQHEIYEIRRQELLKIYRIMDSGGQREYDALCELASRALECTVAAVGFMDTHRQWYKARIGISQPELPRNVAFCSHLLQNMLPTIVMDAVQDSRFSRNPLVTGSAHIRFYATTPICDPASGIVIGSVFVMDPKPKTRVPARAMEILAYLATAAEKLLLTMTKRDEPSQLISEEEGEKEEVRGDAFAPKRERRVHSAPGFLALGKGSYHHSPQSQRFDFRAASLQCVPEEFETKDDFAGLTHALPRNQRERELYQLVDPDVLLPHSSISRRNSESAAILPSPVTARRPSVSVAPRSSSPQQRNELLRLTPQRSVAQYPTQYVASDETCLGLICRITSTQELLAQQQGAFLATLSQHSSRIGSMEQAMDRIEGKVHAIATKWGVGRPMEVEV